MESILIVRLSAIGDIVMATPLAQALRDTWPAARISWLVQPEYQELLDNHPAVDDVITWDRHEWRAHWKNKNLGQLRSAVRIFKRDLKSRQFDLAIDAQGLIKSATLVRWSGAKKKVGLRSPEFSHLMLNKSVSRGHDTSRISSEYLALAKALDLRIGDFRLSLATSPSDKHAAMEIAQRHSLSGDFAVLCPFTTRPQKHWVEERWSELADAIHDEYGWKSVLVGGPDDRDAATRIAEGARCDVISLAGETSLMQSAAIIEAGRLVVGVDTGVGHMGIALNTPTLMLFGSTLPYVDTGTNDAMVLHHTMPCAPCKRRPTCGGAYTCMQLITVEQIMWAAKKVLRNQ